jgi:hypothetical protein
VTTDIAVVNAATGQFRLKNVSNHLKQNDALPKFSARRIPPPLLAPKRLQDLISQPQA